MLWKYGISFCAPTAINYIPKCSSESALLNTAVKYKKWVLLSIFYQIVSSQLPLWAIRTCFSLLEDLSSEKYEFWSMLKVSWRESHRVQFLDKAPQVTKHRDFTAKQSVDLMQAAAKIHLKIKSEQLHIVQGM